MKGIIYKITSPNTDKVYIGSTACKYLCQRKSKHLDDYKQFLNGKRHYKSSYEVIKYGEPVFDLLEIVECNELQELRQRENVIMRTYPTRVNKFGAIRKTVEQQLEDFRV